MKVINNVKGGVDSSESNLTSFVLTNKKGGYYFGSLSNNFSKFNGLFFPYTFDKKTKEWDMMKTVESLGVGSEVSLVENQLGYVEVSKGDVKETYYLNHSDALIYEVKNFSGNVPLCLDCKKIYDDSTKGRVYSISKSKGCYVICYEKFSDDSLTNSSYKFYVAIKTDAKVNLNKSWSSREYPLDVKRGDGELKWVYDALRFGVSSKAKVVISYSEKRATAVNKALEVFDNSDYIKRMKRKYADLLSESDMKLVGRDLVAYKNAVCNLDNLISEVNGVKGIFAGLPWFFHYWARDEAISTVALLKEGNYKLMKKILFRWLQTSVKGRVSNRFPGANLGSADATGWVFFRLHELVLELKSKNILGQYISLKELAFIYSECYERVQEIEANYMKDGLIFNDALETWMDTGREVGDVRDGFCIEIQSLHLAMYNCLIYVGGLLNKKVSLYLEKREHLIELIRSQFFVDGCLKDRLNDATVRSNLFISAYVSPGLLSRREWQLCLSNALDVLFKDGRVLTIPENHSLFCGTHSGQNNHSYHRGDTWYWVDNLAGVVLKRFGKVKFKDQIEQIKQSGINSILCEGAVGGFSEVSSANAKTHEGCLSQAWSYALFIEFMNS